MQNKFLRTLLIAAPFVLAIETNADVAKTETQQSCEKKCTREGKGDDSTCLRVTEACGDKCEGETNVRRPICFQSCLDLENNCRTKAEAKLKKCKSVCRSLGT